MEIKLKENERIDDLEYNGLKIIQKNDGFCFGMDSVILSSFVRVNKKCAIVADFGTGTGIISILLAAKNDNIDKIYGFEIQGEMAEMAQRSVKMNNQNDKIEIVNEDIVGLSKKNWNKKFDIIVSNPPYIPTATIKTLSLEVQKEPKLALDGGEDGLDFYRRISKKAKEHLKDNGFLCFEIGYNQKKDVSEILEKENYKNIKCIKDYNNQDRVIICQK